jgi:hypothetical protein
MRTDELREWAITGARIQLEHIYSTFPELRQTQPQTTPRPNGPLSHAPSPLRIGRSCPA